MNRDKLKAMLAYDEGVIRYPYNDADGKRVQITGNITIGIGRNLDAKPLSDAAIDFLLTEDVEEAETAARRIFPDFDLYGEHRQLALINLIFNLGEAKFLEFSETIKAIRLGDWIGAAARLKRSRWYWQVKSRGVRVVQMVRDDSFPY